MSLVFVGRVVHSSWDLVVVEHDGDLYGVRGVPATVSKGDDIYWQWRDTGTGQTPCYCATVPKARQS